MTNWKYCTPEQGKRLVELGVDNESSKMIYVYNRPKISTPGEWKLSAKSGNVNWDFPEYPAFCCSELGVLLPPDAAAYATTCKTNIITKETYWFCSMLEGISKGEPTEAQCRARALIIFLERGWITAAECNARLKKMNDE
jgi:hypothetical protein